MRQRRDRKGFFSDRLRGLGVREDIRTFAAALELETLAKGNALTTRVFVYGTLRPVVAPDFVRPAVSQFVFVGTGTVRGKLHQFSHYPGLVLDDAGDVIRGEVYELPDTQEIWNLLDVYEGVDPQQPQRSLFIRRRCNIQMESGAQITAFVYEFNVNRWK